MGSSYEYVCKCCGYKAMVSGGKDCGMVAVVETRVCRACNTVGDVLIGQYGNEGPTGDPDYDKDLDHCPMCNSADTHPWPKHRPCPKCGKRMTKGPEAMLWD
jgi:hypothetical protein